MVPATPTSPAKNVPVPELPEAAKEKTPEGAVAFTEFYVELMNYTSTTNDVKPILDVTEPVPGPASQERSAWPNIASGKTCM